MLLSKKEAWKALCVCGSRRHGFMPKFIEVRVGQVNQKPNNASCVAFYLQMFYVCSRSGSVAANETSLMLASILYAQTPGTQETHNMMCFACSEITAE